MPAVEMPEGPFPVHVPDSYWSVRINRQPRNPDKILVAGKYDPIVAERDGSDHLIKIPDWTSIPPLFC